MIKNILVVGAIAVVAMSSSTYGTVSALATSAKDKARTECRVVKPKSAFYEAGRVASEVLTTPNNPDCTTISVKNIKDPGNPDDHCATFLVAFLSPEGGDPTYTEPVEACSEGPHGPETVLATNVPDGTEYFVLYNIDYLGQSLKYQIAH